MTNDMALVPFSYGDTAVRVVVIDGRPWAVAADICGALDIKNSRDALARLDDADKMVIRRSDTVGSTDSIWEDFAPQVQSVGLVSEDGATDLVLDSRKPQARAFRRFLTHTVWPSIRDTGSYSAAPALPQSREDRMVIGIQAMQEIIAERDEQLAVVTNEKKCLEAAIERDAPMVAKAEAHTGSDSAIHRQEFSREVIAWGIKQGVVIKQAEVLRFLGHIGLFIRGERTDTGHATSEAQRRGFAFTHKDTAKNGYAYAVGKLTATGQDYAWKRITKYVADHGTLELPRELRGGESA